MSVCVKEREKERERETKFLPPCSLNMQCLSSLRLSGTENPWLPRHRTSISSHGNHHTISGACMTAISSDCRSKIF